MNVQTIQMDSKVARAYYRDYLKAVRRNREKREEERVKRAVELGKELNQVKVQKTQMEKEDEELLSSYRALLRGQRLVDVHKTISAAGLDEQFLPRLAIAPAEGEFCWLGGGDGRVSFRIAETSYLARKHERVEIAFRPKQANWFDRVWRNSNSLPYLNRVKALVPAIPARLRPDKLDGYFILWEAEWRAMAPVDPLLLKKVNDRFYTIVAQWDLTPLEQSVLVGRL